MISGAIMGTNHHFLRRLRTLSFIEGISTLTLFGIAMPMKYVGGMPMAVTIAGSVHGFLFVLLASMFLLAIKRVPITRGMAMLGIAAAVIPFGPFWMDSRLRRVGGLKVIITS
jgi:integral membrane protein